MKNIKVMELMAVMEKDRQRNVEDNQVQIEQKIVQLRERIAKENNHLVASKITECLNKWKENYLNIGFCGHFSAGKSTMINGLLEKELLPSSPIPTSANVVTIGYGKPQAIIFFTDGTQTTVPITDVDQWKEYCKDGQQVEKVSIFVNSELLEDGVQFLDTPGIDSTDDAHQASTEAALHLADVIIFVTDYNHVQSEVNFHFIKSLKEKGKTLFLIINQIDKHREQELSLATFQQRVKEGLAEWGITVDGLLFTSLKKPEHTYNQFDQVVELFQYIKTVKEPLIHEHLFHTLEVLMEEHGQFLLHNQADQRQAIQENIDQLKEKSGFEENPQLLAEFRQSQEAFSHWKKEIEEEMQKILENAIITPYTTTQAAQALIESYQKDFKIGWLFSKKKTEEERGHRLDTLYDDLATRVTSQMEWHLKELLRKKAEQFHIDDQDYQSAIMEWSLTVPKQWLLDLIKTETVSREFVYSYTKELAKKIHSLYRGKVLQLVEEGKEIFKEILKQRFSGEDSKLVEYRQIEEREKQLSKMGQEIEQQVENYRQSINEIFGSHDYKLEWGLDELNIKADQEEKQKDSQDDKLLLSREAREKRILFNKEPLQRAAVQLDQAADLLASIPSLRSLTKEWKEKAERLRQNQFTICLFGAFSAGKSSFANALLGSHVLPVSPNPTTAAINQVLPLSEQHPAGSAMIKMKSRSHVEEEIAISLKRLHLTLSGNIKKDLQQITSIQPHELRSSLKAYYSFLSACHKGWNEAEANLGSHFEVDEAIFSEYVAVEHKACFVESIQLYHASYLTQQGMEIIDTPGADSIYSRHTNVTFNYIKNADVILYVTYYNHAFSRADQQFLDQLGRVKDQFALDKMFFLVNAADLAESAEELQGVVHHIEQNLLQSGIRFPRIFPISSLRALQGEEESGMEKFEQAFFAFIQEDLTALLVESAQKDVRKAFTLLEEMKKELQSSVEVRQEKMTALVQKEEKWLKAIDTESYPSFLKEIEKEIKEHFYYVRQRLFFNFLGHFQEAFHPSVLSHERGAKQQLPMCLDELLFSFLFQLKEELKATSFRLENFIYRLQERAAIEWQRKLEAENISLNGQFVKKMDMTIPVIPEQFILKNKQKTEHALNHFKNPKQFFEQGGKEKLREELEQSLHSVVDRYMTDTNHTFQEHYVQTWHLAEATLKKELKEEIQLGVASKISALRGDLSATELEAIIEQYRKQVL